MNEKVKISYQCSMNFKFGQDANGNWKYTPQKCREKGTFDIYKRTWDESMKLKIHESDTELFVNCICGAKLHMTSGNFQLVSPEGP